MATETASLTEQELESALRRTITLCLQVITVAIQKPGLRIPLIRMVSTCLETCRATFASRVLKSNASLVLQVLTLAAHQEVRGEIKQHDTSGKLRNELNNLHRTANTILGIVDPEEIPDVHVSDK